MAINDIKVLRSPGYTREYDVDDRTTSSQTTNLLPGEPVKKSGNFVIAVATGDPEVGTDEFVGIARKQSTETSSADGKVEVITMIPGMTMLRGKVTTATNMDTAAEGLGLRQDWVSFDVTGAGTNGPTGVFTFDENEGDDPNVQGFKIIKTDIVNATVDVIVHALATEAAPLVGQTMD